MDISGKLFLAPLAGITDSIFRKICKQNGADFVCTELVSVEALLYENERTMSMLDFSADEKPIGVQLFGSKASSFKTAVKSIEHLDYDYLDINMGCSVKKVLKTGSGAALLKDTGNIFQIVNAVKKVSKKPVSCKIRLGFSENNGIEIAKAIEEAGADFITVHGRLAIQKFNGMSDWDSIGRIRDSIQIPVIGNGDIFTYNDALNKIGKTDAIMIGRGAMGNPWIFRQIKECISKKETIFVPNTHDRIMLLKSHYEMGDTENDNYIRTMRKYFHWYSKGIHSIRKYREKINNTTDYSVIKEIIHEIDQEVV